MARRASRQAERFPPKCRRFGESPEMQVIVTFQDRGLSDYAARLAQLGANAPTILSQALNAAAAETRRKTVAAETAQTGLSGDVIDRAQHEIQASPGRLAFTILSRGGNIRLKFFAATETGSGMTADPWARRTFFPGAWIKAGGGFGGARVDLPFGGEVKRRVGRSRLPTTTVKSGLFIPTEMTRGATAGAFEASAGIIASRIVTRLGALLP